MEAAFIDKVDLLHDHEQLKKIQPAEKQNGTTSCRFWRL